MINSCAGQEPDGLITVTMVLKYLQETILNPEVGKCISAAHGARHQLPMKSGSDEHCRFRLSWLPGTPRPQYTFQVLFLMFLCQHRIKLIDIFPV